MFYHSFIDNCDWSYVWLLILSFWYRVLHENPYKFCFDGDFRIALVNDLWPMSAIIWMKNLLRMTMFHEPHTIHQRTNIVD